MKRTSRYWVKLVAMNLLVAGVFLAFVLLSVEAYLRITIPSSSNESLFESTMTTRRYKVMKRDTRITAWGSEFRTNKLGFRDSKSDVPPKPPSGFRVVVLGDSFTASAGVDFDRIYTTRLEAELRKRLPHAEVLNLAVGGYNIIQYDLTFDEVGLLLQPDMVVVGVFPFNDLSNDTYRANFEDAAGTSKPTQRPWYRSLYVYRAFIIRIEDRVRSWMARGAAPAAAPDHDREQHTEAEENLAALVHLVDTAKAHGVRPIVALLPNTDVFEAQRLDFAPFLRVCRERQWHCVNLLDRFIASGENPKSFRLNLLDGHPNALYNARVAEYLAPELVPSDETHRNDR